MTEFTEMVKKFNSVIEQFRFMEAVKQFYDDNIISTDNSGEPIKGLANLQIAIQKFIAEIKIEKINLLSTIMDDNLSVAHWHYIYTHKNFGKLDYRQLSMQRWQNGKIIQENHFYNLWTK